MEYTIQKLAQLAGISSRTLRYYDEIGILKPARINSSGYRIYGTEQVGRLQQILFYRELGMDLEGIKAIVSDPSFDPATALREHWVQLLDKRKQLNVLIANVEKSIAVMEGRAVMSDAEKFEGFKKQMVQENEEKYGADVRSRYGDDVADRSNQKLLNMTEAQYKEATQLEAELRAALKEAIKTGNPASAPAQRVADMHRQWLLHYWPEYTKAAHRGLAQMYIEDERFRAYYDKDQLGSAEFLQQAIDIYTREEN